MQIQEEKEKRSLRGLFEILGSVGWMPAKISPLLLSLSFSHWCLQPRISVSLAPVSVLQFSHRLDSRPRESVALSDTLIPNAFAKKNTFCFGALTLLLQRKKKKKKKPSNWKRQLTIT